MLIDFPLDENLNSVGYPENSTTDQEEKSHYWQDFICIHISLRVALQFC